MLAKIESLFNLSFCEKWNKKMIGPSEGGRLDPVSMGSHTSCATASHAAIKSLFRNFTLPDCH